MLFTEANLKNLRLTKNGYFRDLVHNISYIYHYACLKCGYPFLGQTKNNKYCSHICEYESDARKKHSTVWLGRKRPDHSIKMSGCNNPNYKNGVTKNNIALYDTYVNQLEPYEQCRRAPDNFSIIEVKCTHCRKYFKPKRSEVCNRIHLGFKYDTHKFYCSDKCKQTCSIYGRTAENIMAIDAKIISNKPDRTYQHTQKKQLLKSNGYVCDMCEAPVTLDSSILHHEVPIIINPLMTADSINLWIFCKACDKKAHQLTGCNYYELRKKNKCRNIGENNVNT